MSTRIKSHTDDSLQFFKEEKVEGAVYNVYLKKVRYHTSPDDLQTTVLSPLAAPVDKPQSTFYCSMEGDEKAKLQWRLEEIKVIKYGTIERLVEALSSETGELDSSYVDAFLSTYRVFSSANEVLNLLLARYKAVSESLTIKQHLKEGHKRSIRTILINWLDSYPEDFKEPPAYPSLTKLRQFAYNQLVDRGLVERLKTQIAELKRQDERTLSLSVEDITVEFGYSLPASSIIGNLSRAGAYENDLFSFTCKHFAEQLTYIDAELFRKVLPYQCLGSVWSRRNAKKQSSRVATVFATVSQFNIVSYRVIATVLKGCLDVSLGDRALIIERWIDIAQELRILKNFSSLKAIVSGLQSTAVFRLSKVWSLISKSKLTLFAELAEIFSEENNQQMCREVLYREGTAKYADRETVNTLRGRKGSGGWGLLNSKSATNRRVSLFDSADSQVIQGTVPYLGTFLTDLTMIDTAFSDRTDSGLINFDKRRKEFEILTQIRLLQCSAGLYRIQQDPTFVSYLMNLRVYDDNESYEMSCEIQPESGSVEHPSQRHKRRSSLGYFTVRGRSNSSSALTDGTSEQNNFTLLKQSETDEHSLRSLPGTTNLRRKKTRALLPAYLRQSASVGSLVAEMTKDEDLPPKPPKSKQPAANSDKVLARIYFEDSASDQTNQYKSILLSNSDRTTTVIAAALQKYNISGDPQLFTLHQRLANGSELLVPDKANVFYAVDVKRAQINFVVRRKSHLELSKNKNRSNNKR